MTPITNLISDFENSQNPRWRIQYGGQNGFIENMQDGCAMFELIFAEPKFRLRPVQKREKNGKI